MFGMPLSGSYRMRKTYIPIKIPVYFIAFNNTKLYVYLTQNKRNYIPITLGCLPRFLARCSSFRIVACLANSFI